MPTAPTPFHTLVVGAGLSGAVAARELAELTGQRVLVIDQRNHIAGNCHTERDQATGVMVHRYGPHLFNTDLLEVWDYVNRFATFRPFINRVKAVTPRGVFGLPINLHTLNQFYGRTMNPVEAREFLASIGDATIHDPQNFEEMGLKLLGRELYENFFAGYTRKQWGCDPRELPASILKRLPVRFNYDDSYYATQWCGIPEEGYTMMIQRILDHPGVEVKLGTPFDPAMIGEFQQVFYTGPVDAFFQHVEGRLRYRTLDFERIEAEGDYQGNAVINYTDEKVPWTRVHEHKHFTPWEEHARTVAFREFPRATEKDDVPYYPVRLEDDRAKLARYIERAAALENISFLGRLGTYRYLDMDDVIDEALQFVRAGVTAGMKFSTFSHPPLA
jgi:UDP-galactopyranose mutase